MVRIADGLAGPEFDPELGEPVDVIANGGVQTEESTVPGSFLPPEAGLPRSREEI